MRNIPMCILNLYATNLAAPWLNVSDDLMNNIINVFTLVQ